MIKTKVFIFSLMALLLCLNANAVELQGQEGNGGAGVVVDGKYQTFYSAGIYTSKIPERTRNIPGIEKLLKEISGFPGLSTTVKSKWIKNVLPTTNRKYYKVLESQINDEAVDDLVGKYKKAVGNQVSNPIGIFAITDKETRTTALLPGFYKLTQFEQMAILFHEAYWLVFPEDSYIDVINAEITAQEYFETKDSLSGLEFLKVIKAQDQSLFYASEYDLKTGRLGDLIRDAKIGVFDFFGESYIECLKGIKKFSQSVDEMHDKNTPRIDVCKQFVLEEHYLKSLRYKDSLLLYLLPAFEYELAIGDYTYKDGRASNYYENVINRYSLEQLKRAYIRLKKQKNNDITIRVEIGFNKEGVNLETPQLLFLFKIGD